MYRLISKLVIYKELGEDSILVRLSELIKEVDSSLKEGTEDIYKKEQLISGIYTQINRLLSLATDYGFTDNLWHNYLAYILAMAENPFSITC